MRFWKIHDFERTVGLNKSFIRHCYGNKMKRKKPGEWHDKWFAAESLIAYEYISRASIDQRHDIVIFCSQSYPSTVSWEIQMHN